MTEAKMPSEGLAKLTRRVDGYEGYEHSETRSISDEIIRRKLIDDIENMITLLSKEYMAKDAADQKTLVNYLDSTQRKLKVICNSLESPTYLQGQFFLPGNVNNTRLERIYEAEWTMVEELALMKEELESVQPVLSSEDIEDHFLHISNYVDDLNQALFEREALIIGEA